MTANHLRIGNWVHEFMIPTQIDSRMLQKIESANERGKIIIDLSPIPITPEVLEKCGFKKCLGVYVINNACIFSGLSKINIYIKEYDTDYEFTCPNYLHQLQNLYFALTGEELQYTP